MKSRHSNNFCLIHKSGDLLYPVRIRDRETGVVAFRLSRGGANGNTKALSLEENDEDLLLSRVVEDGWAIRASTLSGRRQGLYKLGRRNVIGIRQD